MMSFENVIEVAMMPGRESDELLRDIASRVECRLSLFGYRGHDAQQKGGTIAFLDSDRPDMSGADDPYGDRAMSQGMTWRVAAD